MYGQKYTCLLPVHRWYGQRKDLCLDKMYCPLPATSCNHPHSLEWSSNRSRRCFPERRPDFRSLLSTGLLQPYKAWENSKSSRARYRLRTVERTYTKCGVFGTKVVAAKEVTVVGVPEPVGVPGLVVITYS